MRTSALLVAAIAAAAAFAGMCHSAQALTLIPPPKITVGGTCQAAHEADSRVNATFCTTRLRKEPRAIDADTAGLAEAATAVGFRNAEGARSECDMLYGIICKKYAAVREAIAEQRYGEVERELSSVPLLGHICDSGIARARSASASPFLHYSEDNTQITLLTLAITSLIK
ncbi:pectinesterase inhibitor 8-like [Lolium perenne]|uniref:pectinesterase inhibitor 8-like n=1 Tax=Lolium perenne TaxID=4522 RepID=UPI0021F68A72|nr:pectinesterase inhibitor 8-like [Lolium perenne]